jgi:hypothetical protein
MIESYGISKKYFANQEIMKYLNANFIMGL